MPISTKNVASEFVGTAELWGFHVNPGTMHDYINLLESQINRGEKANLFAHNLHTLYEYFRSEKLEKAYRDSFVLIDGMPLIPLLKLAGFNAQRSHRVTYADFIWPLLEHAAARGWRVFYVGQPEEVQEAAFANIKKRFPDIIISGHHGFFDSSAGSDDSKMVIDQINSFHTDLCIVGMGTPLQEYWVEEHRELIDAPALIVSGACLEYVSGVVGTPPRWMGRWGLEWSYRFFENPKRFASRYFIEPWVLAYLMLSRNLFKRATSE